jgi:DNA-binding CsgD family transcriptional regulator
MGSPLRVPDLLRDARTSAFVLWIVDPAREHSTPEHWLRKAYGLTEAEARLAVTLANGHSLEEISSSTATRVSTLKTHLKRLMSKTNTRRQAEVTRLVFGASGPKSND